MKLYAAIDMHSAITSRWCRRFNRCWITRLEHGPGRHQSRSRIINFQPLKHQRERLNDRNTIRTHYPVGTAFFAALIGFGLKRLLDLELDKHALATYFYSVFLDRGLSLFSFYHGFGESSLVGIR